MPSQTQRRRSRTPAGVIYLGLVVEDIQLSIDAVEAVANAFIVAMGGR
jgi:hypothetical protein